MKKALYYTLVVILVAIFLFSAWSLGSYFLDAMKNDRFYEDLNQQMHSAQGETLPTVYVTVPVPEEDPWDPDTPELPEFETQESQMVLPEYTKLYLQNPDMVGWITIEGTKINYPVVQSPDREDYYLHRNFSGEYSDRGCIYAEEDCDVFAPSDNVTLYGHHMYDGSMFSALTNYDRKSYWEAHRYITFNTLVEHRTYEIVAVFKTTATEGEGFRYHRFANAATKTEFDNYVTVCKRLSFYDTGVEVEYGDKLITLSTCEYSLVNGRFVVVAKLIETDDAK